MKISNQDLINELQSKVTECLEKVEALKNLPTNALEWRENSESWNILECIEHLNRYGDFYLPEIKKRMTSNKTTNGNSLQFKYHWWGNFFVNAIAPQPKDQLKKMNAFKKLNPHFDHINRTILDTFIDQQHQMLEILEEVRGLNLNKIKTNSTIKFVKLRLGDTLRAEIYHNQRHINQAYDVLEKAPHLVGL